MNEDWLHKVLALATTAGFFGVVVVFILGYTAPGIAHDILVLLVGALVSKWGTIIDYFFGSSSNSKKDVQ